MTILEAIKEKTLLCDGAMGTQLQTAGLEPGDCGDGWNLDHPERVLAIQTAYVESGADCLTTNTFGACRLSLERHDLAGEVATINRAAVRIAREALDGREGFVLGDIGPFGGLLEPYGAATEKEVRAAFVEQVAALVKAGVDAIIIETQTALEEVEIAIQSARDAGAAIVLASMSFDVTHDGKDLRTMMGVAPEQAAEMIQKTGADAIGTNCGKGVDSEWASKALVRYRSVSDLPLFAQPNAGQPEIVDGKISYAQSASEAARGVSALLEAGARIIGACCGSTPEHIAALRARLDSQP